MKEQVWSGFQLACEGLYIGGVVIACRDGVLEEEVVVIREEEEEEVVVIREEEEEVVVVVAGVTHILNVTPNEKNFFPDRFVYKRIAVDDDSKAKLDKHFNECYSFINNAIQGGGKVFTHCSAGVSRSSTVVIYFLMRSYKLYTDCQ
ncbi:hypothetical protein GUITHDRAFT_145688 [Guillardia theta CCMP2712]|uniref:Protein-tyrosine-phosphatase n=1 Tax=Guillardia theta (strain CCMP2712) TaxID=905079 RepID=L1IL44_GUITC|nr:hypothetical protein GUITHDRAFT_145688 [Guillardia theta CCMP2712]EKX36520.1 hypothetical protein GUITHDRAFT_145688 [Guillardia theta CCMP2712]|eukprot:XP_005823500.1 hypothetical protein GUITHDRAFT_145688 [Guillardia theta CCMP2712]